MFFFCSGCHLGYHVTLSCHAFFLGCSGLWQVLRLLLFLMVLTVLTSQVFYIMFLFWDLPDVFLVIKLGLQVLGRKTCENFTTEVKCHSHYIISGVHIYCQRDLSLSMLTLITWLRPRLPGFSTVKLFFFLSFLHCTFWKEVLMYSP